MTPNRWWAPVIERLLPPLDGLSNEKAGEILGVDATTVFRWRNYLEAGEEIPAPRGNARKVLWEARQAMRTVTERNGLKVEGEADARHLAQLDAILLCEAALADKRAAIEALAAAWRSAALERVVGVLDRETRLADQRTGT